MANLKQEYQKNFGSYKIPETLEKLMQFENKYEGGSYAHSFYLCSEMDKTPDHGQYSLDDEYFERLLIFANADGSGGKFCFWINEKGMDLENAPIIFLGSEGSDMITAKNLKELIRQLSFGPENMDGSWWKDVDEYEEPENADEFRVWMKAELNILPVENRDDEFCDDVEKIVEEAQKEYGEAFKKWMQSLTPQYDAYESKE